MKFDKTIIEKLRTALKQSLPGEDIQYRMAPSYRARLSKEEILTKSPRQGGVLLLLYEKNDSLNIVLTQRKAYDGVHGGQMSFPGGKREGQETLIETALRETCEEVGIHRSQIEIIGRLTELYIPPSNFMVYPAVGFAEKIEAFTPQQAEVETIVEIPVDFFLDKRNINPEQEIKLFNDVVVRVPAYVYNDHIIWGATAIILSEFTFIMEKVVAG
ncbi:MAG: hydrolase [Bacteroidota bacterium]|nr:hydrolase [Bacteroidota bacterium]